MQIIRRSKTNRLEESLDHVDGKEKITHILKYGPITLTNHKNKTKTIRPTNIKYIKQEYTWYKIIDHLTKPLQSFSADIAFINEKGKIEAIVEVVKSNRISEAKYNFYETQEIFWLELHVNEIKNNINHFKSTFLYDEFKTYKINLTPFKTEDEILTGVIKYNYYLDEKTRKKFKKQTKKQIKDEIKYKEDLKRRKANRRKKDQFQNKMNQLRQRIKQENPNWSLIQIDAEVYKQLEKSVPSSKMK